MIDIVPTHLSKVPDLKSEIELSITLLEEAVDGGTQDNIERSTQIAEATLERVTGFLVAGNLGREARALLDEGLKRIELALNAVDDGNRARSAPNE